MATHRILNLDEQKKLFKRFCKEHGLYLDYKYTRLRPYFENYYIRLGTQFQRHIEYDGGKKFYLREFNEMLYRLNDEEHLKATAELLFEFLFSDRDFFLYAVNDCNRNGIPQYMFGYDFADKEVSDLYEYVKAKQNVEPKSLIINAFPWNQYGTSAISWWEKHLEWNEFLRGKMSGNG